VRDFIAKLFGFDQEIQELKGKIRALSWDDAFGMWTRGAFLHFCEVMPRGPRTVVFLDFCGVHEMNLRLGYREVDARIQRTFAIPFRTSDVIARWYSGDEVVILFDGSLAGVQRKMAELDRSAAANGIRFRWDHDTWQVGQETIQEVVARVASRVNRKERGRRSRSAPLVRDAPAVVR
jgi:hypothetical protein